ncbi:MAG: hypothetical protein E7233_02325 [Lachnospiraceae bacterium]|nr:hypothetical protein [Lachnospiraceae bacterium]
MYNETGLSKAKGIAASLSLEQKAAQMVMPAVYNISPNDMKDNDYGSILSTPGALDAGVQTIMIGHSSLNGVKMHENKEFIMKLKDEMGQNRSSLMP